MKNRTIELRFRSIVTPTARLPMVQVADIETGEILMVELLSDTATWLQAMNYEWLEGSPAIWKKTK